MFQKSRHGVSNQYTAAPHPSSCVTVRTIHLLSRTCGPAWLMTLAKPALACGPSAGPRVHGCGESTLRAGSRLRLHPSRRRFPQMSSPSSITLPSQVLPPSPPHPPPPGKLSSPCCTLLHLWLPQKRRDCVQMCLERGQPLCPGRTCGLGVFTLALFQAVSHTACWRLALLDDNAQPSSSHERGFLRLG